MAIISEKKKFNFLRGFSIFTLAWSKYLSSKRRNLIVLIILGIPVLLSLLLLLTRQPDLTSFELSSRIVNISFTYYISFGVMILLFFATFITSDELSDKTISYLFHSPISREELFFWKYLGFITFSLSLFLTLEIICIAIFSIPYLNTLDESNYKIFLGLIEITAINIIYYGSFFFFLSVATDRPIIYGLIVGFSDQILLGTIFPDLLGAYSLSYHVRAISYYILGKTGSLNNFKAFMNIHDSFYVIFLLIILFDALTILVVRRKEIL